MSTDISTPWYLKSSTFSPVRTKGVGRPRTTRVRRHPFPQKEEVRPKSSVPRLTLFHNNEAFRRTPDPSRKSLSIPVSNTPFFFFVPSPLRFPSLRTIRYPDTVPYLLVPFPLRSVPLRVQTGVTQLSRIPYDLAQWVSGSK